MYITYTCITESKTHPTHTLSKVYIKKVFNVFVLFFDTLKYTKKKEEQLSNVLSSVLTYIHLKARTLYNFCNNNNIIHVNYG